MTRAVALLAAFAALASPVSIHAQDELPSEEPDAITESLQCAIWASYFAIVYDGQPDGEAFARARDYFVGRYEGLSGEGIDEALDEDLIVSTAGSLDELTPLCTARMNEYGQRELDWSKALEDIAKRLPGDGDSNAVS